MDRLEKREKQEQGLTMDTPDEREGLTSASNALYDLLCPGRHNAQRGLEPAPESEEARIGNVRHRLFQGQDVPEASQEDLESAMEAAEICRRVTDTWLESLKQFFPNDANRLLTNLVVIAEQRVWIYQDGRKIHSGKPDRVTLAGFEGGPVHGLIVDLKSLWGQQDEAGINQQLRDYAAMYYLRAPDMGYSQMDSCTVFIDQPARTKEPKLARYEGIDLLIASNEMLERVANSNDPNAPRIAGAIQCKYCRAKLICPEYIETLSSLPDLLPGSEPSKADIETAAKGVSPRRLAQLLDLAPMLTQAASAIKTEAKRRLEEDPASVPGWKLVEGDEREKIADIVKVYSRCIDLGIDPTRFTARTSITKKSLEELLREVGLRGAELESVLKGAVEGAVETKRTAKELERDS